jgi:hypothetical protein
MLEERHELERIQWPEHPLGPARDMTPPGPVTALLAAAYRMRAQGIWTCGWPACDRAVRTQASLICRRSRQCPMSRRPRSQRQGTIGASIPIWPQNLQGDAVAVLDDRERPPGASLG